MRIVNQSFRPGTVRITAIDDIGARFGPVTLSLDAGETVNFNSRDLERGNASKGLPVGVGDGSGSWRLVLETDLGITPLAYIRTSDGFVTSMHDVAPETEDGSRRYRVVFFNPGANRSQVSRLRLINPGTSPARVEITARDDAGAAAPGGPVRLTLAAGAARTLTAQELEAGGDGFEGSFGGRDREVAAVRHVERRHRGGEPVAESDRASCKPVGGAGRAGREAGTGRGFSGS